MNRVVDYIIYPKAVSSSSQLGVHIKAIFFKTTTTSKPHKYHTLLLICPIKNSGGRIILGVSAPKKKHSCWLCWGAVGMSHCTFGYLCVSWPLWWSFLKVCLCRHMPLKAWNACWQLNGKIQTLYFKKVIRIV